MFDYIRNNTRLMGILLALFIVPAFVLVGVDGYKSFNAGGETVAVVAGTAIKKDQWDAAHRTEVDRIRASNPGVDARLLDSDAARYASLERLVRDQLVSLAAVKMNLLTSDAKLVRELQQDPFISSLRKPDGSLDMERYREVLQRQGMSQEGYEAQIRLSLSQRQVTQGVLATGLVTPAMAKPSLDAFFERREVQVARFDPAQYKARVQVTDAEIEQYHQANSAQFQAPEQADIEYLVLDLPSVMQNLSTNEADIKSYYEQNAARYTSKEERRARHILVNAPKEMPEAARADAKARAQALAAQVQAAPASFAEVARRQSQDPGSAPAGGDLGFFQRDAMVKPFSDAAFGLAKGAVSGVVETDFGFHVIQMVDIKPAVQRPLEQVRAEIETELKKQLVQREFADKAVAFGNLVYEQADALAPVAEKLRLKVQTAQAVTRQPKPGTPPLLANEKLLSELFSPEAVTRKQNTQAVETGANQLVAARILAHRPAHTLPLAEVRAQVKEILQNQKAQALAREDGEKALADWKGGAPAKLGALQVLSREKPQNLPAKAVSAALRADPKALPAWTGVDLGAQGYVVLRVTQVVPREKPAADVAQQELRQYEQWWTSAEGLAYYNSLKRRFKTEIKVPRPVQVSGA